MTALNPELRRQVINIYKGLVYIFMIEPHQATYLIMIIELLHLGKEYPLGFSYFRPRLHRAFMANAKLRSDEDIQKGIERAEFVRKGMAPTNQFSHL